MQPALQLIKPLQTLSQVDLNGDGSKEVIVATHDAHLQVICCDSKTCSSLRGSLSISFLRSGTEASACWANR